jgi:nicotinamide-nucleotide amidase
MEKPLSIPPLARALADRLLAARLTLSAAESCTGGAFSAACTALPGSSAWYLGCVVAYANAAKTDLLGVPADLINTHGAVSRPVALAMAQGALDRFHSDLAVSVTGIAGPTGGTPEKPVGTVWIALAKQNTPPVADLLHLRGTRRAIQRQTVAALFRLLLTAL